MENYAQEKMDDATDDLKERLNDASDNVRHSVNEKFEEAQHEANDFCDKSVVKVKHPYGLVLFI